MCTQILLLGGKENERHENNVILCVFPALSPIVIRFSVIMNSLCGDFKEDWT